MFVTGQGLKPCNLDSNIFLLILSMLLINFLKLKSFNITVTQQYFNCYEAVNLFKTEHRTNVLFTTKYAKI